jgi:nitrite reductase/ring-hydroxylating ferredoxin subunit
MITLCSIDELEPGSSRGFALEHINCFVVRSHDGDVFVYRNSCPHLGVELEWVADQFLDAEGYLIQCSTHGALFQIDTGHCVAGPCLGQYLQTIPFVVKDGAIEITSTGGAG